MVDFELLDMMFFEDYIKECIIDELMTGLKIAENKNTSFLRGCSDMILTYARISEEVYKFALTNIVLFDFNNKDSYIIIRFKSILILHQERRITK